MVFHTAHQFRTRSSFRLLCQNTWQTDDLSLVSALLGWRNVPFHSRWHRLQPQTNITLFFALGERGATVHHRMVKLATKWETSGDNRWLPRLARRISMRLRFTDDPKILLPKLTLLLVTHWTCLSFQLKEAYFEQITCLCWRFPVLYSVLMIKLQNNMIKAACFAIKWVLGLYAS